MINVCQLLNNKFFMKIYRWNCLNNQYINDHINLFFKGATFYMADLIYTSII